MGTKRCDFLKNLEGLTGPYYYFRESNITVQLEARWGSTWTAHDGFTNTEWKGDTQTL